MFIIKGAFLQCLQAAALLVVNVRGLAALNRISCVSEIALVVYCALRFFECTWNVSRSALISIFLHPEEGTTTAATAATAGLLLCRYIRGQNSYIIHTGRLKKILSYLMR